MLVLGAIISFPLTLHGLVLANQTGFALILMAAVYLAVLAPALHHLFKHKPLVTVAIVALLLALATLITLQLDKLALLFLPPVAINLWLMLLFGTTLRAGSTPFISRVAQLERGTLEPELARYTRRLTWLWTLLFLAMALESLLLALFAPIEVWSWFVNVWNYVFVALLFVGEWLYRRIRFAHYHHASPIALFRLVRGNWQTVFGSGVRAS